MLLISNHRGDMTDTTFITTAAEPVSLAVISCSGEWRLLTARRQFGHFHHRSSAWAVAVELAKEAAASGRSVELLLQGEDSDFALNFVYRSPELAEAAA